MERLQYRKNLGAAGIIAAHYGRTPSVFIRSFGCQQNVNDTERLKGVLLDMGYVFANDAEDADLIVFNTCAVREHAEQRVYGNIGALKALKQQRPGLLLAVCGCMAVEKTTIDKLRESYPYVDIVLGPNPADKLPDLLVEKMTTRKKALRVPAIHTEIVENVPLVRESHFRAFLPIMFGCDNYCSYCIVPYVRGRERSRLSGDILEEFTRLVQSGYKEITLLGQNVNSYGRGNDEKLDFSDLLALLCKVPGDYKLRLMTSHPKDATRKMVDTIAAHPQLCKHLHLPIQSGSNEILSRMNRRYTAEDYLALIRYAREVCPEMTFSTDIVVGFPGESEADFAKTLDVVRAVGFTQLFTFIYSRRPGTPAAEYPDDNDHRVKSERIQRLLEVQENIMREVAAPWLDKRFACLVEGVGREAGTLHGRLDNNMLVEFAGEPALVGGFANVTIEQVNNAMLKGRMDA